MVCDCKLIERVLKNPDGSYRRSRYHGADGAPEGASYLYFLGDKPKAQAFEGYMTEHPSAVDLWLGGHTHTSPDDVLNGRSHVESKWGSISSIVRSCQSSTRP